MAYNVISCKESKETTKNLNRRFFYVNSAPELRNHSKKTLHSIAICSIFLKVWCIIYMLAGEFSCSGGSEYVCQRG